MTQTTKHEGTTEERGAQPLNNARREQFCREYGVDFNGAAAAKRAGYSASGARQTARRLLTDDHVQARVAYIQQQRHDRAEVDAQTVLSHLLSIATFDPRSLFDAEGRMLPPEQWPDEAARAVSSLDVTEQWIGSGEDAVFNGYTRKVRLWDKPKSLELLARHLSLLTDNVNHKGGMTAHIEMDTQPQETK